MIKHFFWILTLAAFACTDPIKETRQVFTQDDVAVEVGREVEILYSDSAIVRVRVTGPVLHNFSGSEKPRQEFPEGIKMEFLLPEKSLPDNIEHYLRSTVNSFIFLGFKFDSCNCPTTL